MKLPDVRKANLKGKRVLLRVDFNVKFSAEGKPQEIYKILSVKETIDLILANSGLKLALLSHCGRPDGVQKEFSFVNSYKEIGKVLGREIIFINDCVGGKVKEALGVSKEGQILMLENVRFYKEEEAEGNEAEVFAQKLADNFDVYVNEAFGVSNRDHASITKITKILPSYSGLNLQKEAEGLGRVRTNFEKPAVAVIGGAKIETKMPVINFFANCYDYVLVAGKIGLEAQKNKIVFSNNVILPKDYLGGGLDIGLKTVKEFSNYLKKAKTIVWNGPMGKFEEPLFDKGTIAIVNAITENKSAYKVAGGGETVQVLEKNDLISKFDFISTGGGAMLEFLAKGTLPGIEALIKSEKWRLNI